MTPSNLGDFQAYRQRAKACHPDVNPAPEAEAAFKRLSEAYETLSNVGSRSMYDFRMGQHAARAASAAGAGPSAGPSAGGGAQEDPFAGFEWKGYQQEAQTAEQRARAEARRQRSAEE